MERKPVNEMALALDEARVRADQLATSLNNDYESFKKIIEQTQSGMWSKLFNKGVDQTLGNQMTDQLANIRTLERMQRDALKQGDQSGADDYGAKVRAAQEAAIAFADSQVATRKGMANVGTVREAPYEKVYGPQGMNFDAIANFKDLVSGQEDVADQQKRNTDDQSQLKMLEAQKKAAEQAKQAQEAIVAQWRKNLDEQKIAFDDVNRQEAQFWVQRMEEAKKGSLSYVDALDEANKSIARLHEENVRGGKEFDKLSAASYMPDAMDQSRGDNPEMASQGRDTTAWLRSMNQGIALRRESANAIAEASQQIDLMTGRISRMDAAQETANRHAKDFADALDRINSAIANAQDLPPGLYKQQTLNNLGNQKDQLTSDYQIQAAKDAQGISENTVSGAMGNSISQMTQSMNDLASALKTVIPQFVQSMNANLVHLMTGTYKSGDLGKTFMGAGQSVLNASLSKLEGGVLKKLGLGKADGSKENPFYTIAAAGLGAPAGIDTTNPTVTAGIDLTKLIPGTGFLQTLISGLPHFAAGGDIIANHPSLIGERGPELFMPGMSGRVIPNDQLDGMGGSHTHFHFNIQGNSDPAAMEAMLRRAAPQIVAGALQTHHQHAMRRPQGR
jgi:hypothetical protein